MASGMALCASGHYSSPPGDRLRRRHSLRQCWNPVFRGRRACISAQYSGSDESIGSVSGSEDPLSKFLSENPSRVERKIKVGDKMYTLKEWRRMQTETPIEKIAYKLKSSAGQEQERAASSQAPESQQARPIYLKELLREYKGDLYVPEEVFKGELGAAEKFDKEFSELPEMLLEDFLKHLNAEQVRSLKSKGTKFIVELRSYPGQSKSEKWSMRLPEDEAQYVLAQYRGYHHVVKPRFTPSVIQPPPTPNPVAAAISGRIMLEVSTVASLITTAAFATSNFVSATIASLVSGLLFLVFRVLLPVISPIARPFVRLAVGIVTGIWGLIVGDVDTRRGLFGFAAGTAGFITNGDLFVALRVLGAMVLVIVVMAALTKFTLTRRSRDHQKWDIWQALKFALSKEEARVKGPTGVTFADVAGIDEVVDELTELVRYLKDPQLFSKMGTKPPHGVLLEGSPGCGKTLLAKAVAGEAGVPFYQMAGSEFVEVLVGVGAARMRDLFARAKVNRPAVVFIDEIDALGGARSITGGLSGRANSGLQERETTLNQLLIELDGFDTGKGVIFLGATNRADMLDPALLRPGRFDRRIMVSLPNTEARYKILQVHAKKVKLDESVDLWPFAKSLNGWNGAKLAQLMQESALVALRKGRTAITSFDIDTAADRLTLGNEIAGAGRRQSVHRRMATVEIGMAMAAELLRKVENAQIEPCHRISIVPRGTTFARSVYDMLDDESYRFASFKTIVQRLKVLLASRVAEEIVYGRETSSISAGYLADANWLARKIYTIWNLDGPITTHGEEAPWSRYSRFGPPLWFEGGLYATYGLTESSLNPEIDQQFIDRSKQLVERSYKETRALLMPYKAALLKALHVIMEKEELLGHELLDILGHYTAGYPIELVEAEKEPGALVFSATAMGSIPIDKVPV